MASHKSKQSVLITGCSEGGIGYALAREFQSRGLCVFATGRTLSKMASLEDLSNITLLALDVTSADSISAAMQTVKHKTGGRLTYLINNSGTQYLSPILDTDINMAKDMFDVNIWGVLAVTKAFAPLVIEAKGTIVNIASIAGCLSPPWMGLYSGSKSCLATISEVLRLEVKPFGVKVATVITGAVQTNLFVNTPEYQLPADSRYKAARKEIASRATGVDVPRRSTTEEFAQDLVQDILRGATGKVYRGEMATSVRYATACIPTAILDKIVVKGVGLEKVTAMKKTDT